MYVHYRVFCGSYNKFIIPVLVMDLSLCSPAPPGESGALCPPRSAAGAEPAPPLWRGDAQTPWGWGDCPAGQGSETKLSLWQTRGVLRFLPGGASVLGRTLSRSHGACPWRRKAAGGPLASCSPSVGRLEGSPLCSERSVGAAPELVFFQGSRRVPAGGVTPGRPRPPPGTQLGRSGP